MYFGLSYMSTRRLAYEYASKLKREKAIKEIPKSWEPATKEQQGLAGRKWLHCFKTRHPQLTLRKPQMVSLGRASAFNKHNVSMFFENLKDAITRFDIRPENIWNMDETALTTVHRSEAVIAERGVRHLGALSSAERGVLVTLALCVSARGMCMPPFYIFPRKKFHDHFLIGAAKGASGDANQSGWMKKEQFLKFLVHFERYARPSNEVKSLLILDNHESHMSIEGLDYCKAHGIVVLTLPPHTSHKLQPLDRSVFKSIKALYFKACSDWMKSTENAGKTITIHDIPQLSCEAIKKGASIANIEGGFRASGIYPLNEDVFETEEFCSASFTDRLNPHEDGRPHTPDLEMENDELDDAADLKNSGCETGTRTPEADQATETSTSAKVKEEPASSLSEINFESTLESIQPFPKARPRKQTKSGRKVRKSSILTDDKSMELLRTEQRKVADKKSKILAAKAERVEKKTRKTIEKAIKEAQKSARNAAKLQKPNEKLATESKGRRGRPSNRQQKT